MNKLMDKSKILTNDRPYCYLCGALGENLYKDMPDYLYNGTGVWNFKKCPVPDCGLIWLDPMPEEQEIYKAYQNYHTHEKGEKKTKNAYLFIRGGYFSLRFNYTGTTGLQRILGLIIFIHPRWKAEAELAIMQLKAMPGGRLLDIGCGRGDTQKLLQSLGWETEGLEVDPIAANIARKRGLKVRIGTLAGQRYPDNSFDVITMNHVIEHVHDPLRLLSEVYRILKKSGTVVIATPNCESYGHRTFKHFWRGLEPPRHIFLYGSKALKSLFKNAGFVITNCFSSARMASFMYSETMVIQSKSKRMNFQVNFITYLQSVIFYLTEWALMKFKPWLGEEVILCCKK
jgi:2-polyprenyl-3-methyl-5-hydroxy-6-metoxy-1,4-benzoquinol methylase